MALHFISFLFSAISIVLFILANIGTTFSSSTLNKIYLVQVQHATTGRSIRYGVYSSCLYYNTSMPQTCTSNVPAYSFGKLMIINSHFSFYLNPLFLLDAIQLATACGVDRANSSMLSRYASIVSSSSNLNSLFKCIVIILPTTLLAFVAFSCKYNSFLLLFFLLNVNRYFTPTQE